MDRIIQSYMNDFLKSQQITEKDIAKQFEFFSAYCVLCQQYSDLFDVNDIATGAGGDCGIDSLAIISNGTVVSSKDEVDDLIEINKSLIDTTFIFVQSKTSSSFSASEIGTFGAGVLDFFSTNPQFVRNEFVSEKSKIVEYILEKAIFMKVKPTCLLYYVTTGKWVEDKNCVARMEMVKNDLQELNIFSNIQIIPVDVERLQKYYRSTIDVIEQEINFSEKILLPEIENVTQAYLGYIDVKEYLKLITGDGDEIRKSVFYDNVRDYQGENPVNTEIADTIKNESNHFILYNNGVTIICKKLSNLRNKFTLTDYQIVNGCQTSHVLFYSKDKINGDLQIPVKLIETTDEETVNKIIKATNRQTEVSDEQLVALNEFHRNLEAFYTTYTGQGRLYYERRSKQYSYITEIEKVRIVSISTQIKAVASMFYDKPHLASRYYGRLLKSVDGIFSNEHKLLPYYTSAFLLYKLEYLFRNKMIPAKYRKFRFFILMLVKYNMSNGKVPEMNSKKMEDLCNKILTCINDNANILNELNKVFIFIDKYVDAENEMELSKSATLVEQLKLEYIKK